MSITAVGEESEWNTDSSSADAAISQPAEHVSVTTGAEQPCRLGVVDDHDVMIAGLRGLLSDCSDIEFEVGARTVDQLLILGNHVNLVLLDLRLADGSSPETNTRQLSDFGVKTLVYTSGEDPYLMRSALRAGASAVVLKSETPDVIIGAIRQVHRGDEVMGTDLALAIDSDEHFTSVHLSPQQRRVLELFASGETTTRVSRMTGLSVDTVNGYLQRIRQKYAQAGRPAQTKIELFKRAVEDGWLPIPRSPHR